MKRILLLLSFLLVFGGAATLHATVYKYEFSGLWDDDTEYDGAFSGYFAYDIGEYVPSLCVYHCSLSFSGATYYPVSPLTPPAHPDELLFGDTLRLIFWSYERADGQHGLDWAVLLKFAHDIEVLGALPPLHSITEARLELEFGPQGTITQINPVPETFTMLLLTAGLIGLGVFRMKFKK